MLRRTAVTLSGLLITGFLAAGSAAAAPADEDRRDDRYLTLRDEAGLRIAGEVLDTIFGGGPFRGSRR
ncbi:hypothetical protein ACFY12_11080 [Streptomyces sp. NPDC001339]|uniref:hypothetical protein n=1 Tax=Streptomyces sp. NPDC001339 TaxID=3364563 RepID=UPI00369DE239